MFASRLFYLAILLTFFGCAQGEISIQSLPSDAEVSVVEPDGKIKSLGKTPFNVKLEQVFRPGTQFSQIKVAKDEHYPETMVLTKSTMPVSYELSVALQRQLQDPKALEANSRNERVAQQIAQANNYINTKRLFEAEQLMTKFVQDFPHISVGHDYMGNINYLKKDFKRAIYHYEKALQINPENVETRAMVERLRGMFN